jgi:hypothetical protein
LPVILQHTNGYIAANRLGLPVTSTEMLAWMGIRLGMTLERSRGTVEDFWSTEAPGFLRPGDYYQRTGMTLGRYRVISRAFHLATPQAPSSQEVRNCVMDHLSNL